MKQNEFIESRLWARYHHIYLVYVYNLWFQSFLKYHSLEFSFHITFSLKFLFKNSEN